MTVNVRATSTPCANSWRERSGAPRPARGGAGIGAGHGGHVALLRRRRGPLRHCHQPARRRPGPVQHARTLAASVPNDAIFFADASNVGASASAGLARLRDQRQQQGEWRDGPAAADRGGARRAAGRALQLDRWWRAGGRLGRRAAVRGHGPGGHRCRCRHPATAPAAEPAQPGDDGSIGRSRDFDRDRRRRRGHQHPLRPRRPPSAATRARQGPSSSTRWMASAC